MIRSKVQVVNNFEKVSARVDKIALESVTAAAEAAEPVAQAGASIDLELEVIPGRGDIDGYSAGIRSKKKTSNPDQTTPLALFFDKGTLGNRKKALKQPGRREESWEVKRRSGGYTARRHAVANKGIKPEGFFGKARAAGRAALVRHITRGG